jgi:hypothetical protein
MAEYYNKSPVSLAVTLKSGGTAFLAGKAWTEVSADEEGSEDVIRAVQRGFIIRSTMPATALAPTPAPVSTQEAVSDVKTPDAPSPPPDSPSESSMSGEKNSDNPSRRRKG